MLYIGHFLHTTNQEEEFDLQRRHGEFSLILDAENNDAAVEKFKERILDMRKSSDYFDGDCAIYFVQLMEFDKFPTAKPMILNYKSYAGDPRIPYISCSTREDNVITCRIYNWENNIPEIDGQNEMHFLEFRAREKDVGCR